MTTLLRRWYLRRRRDLPWRRTRDPYAIWVSEVMLQQTTAAAAGPRWESFLARFPSVRDLARASEADALAEWSGLGYYSRARNLHRAARTLAERGGELPRTAAELRRLPGIGPYTAAAVASIAFDEPAAVVDGNVARVLCRLFALRVDPKSARGARRLHELALGLLPRRHPGDHNQALMELGATVCLPRAPRCGGCPFRRICAARELGTPELFPRSAARPRIRRLRIAAGLALRGGRLVLVPDTHLVRGHLGVPLVALDTRADAAPVLARAWESIAGRRALRLEPVATLRHSVLARRYEVHLFRVVESRADSASPAGLRLAAVSELAAIPHGGLLRKVLRAGGLPSRG